MQQPCALSLTRPLRQSHEGTQECLFPIGARGIFLVRAFGGTLTLVPPKLRVIPFPEPETTPVSSPELTLSLTGGGRGVTLRGPSPGSQNFVNNAWRLGIPPPRQRRLRPRGPRHQPKHDQTPRRTKTVTMPPPPPTVTRPWHPTATNPATRNQSPSRPRRGKPERNSASMPPTNPGQDTAAEKTKHAQSKNSDPPKDWREDSRSDPRKREPTSPSPRPKVPKRTPTLSTFVNPYLCLCLVFEMQEFGCVHGQ